MDIAWVKSSHSFSNSNCVQVTWVKSSRSLANHNGVQVAEDDGRMLVRDSKDPDGAVLAFTRAEWQAFLKGAKNDEFDTLLGAAAEREATATPGRPARGHARPAVLALAALAAPAALAAVLATGPAATAAPAAGPAVYYHSGPAVVADGSAPDIYYHS